jgi:hypothetical protein
MYLCVSGIHCASFYDLLLDFGTDPTVCVFLIIILHEMMWLKLIHFTSAYQLSIYFEQILHRKIMYVIWAFNEIKITSIVI